jgi:predicted RNase H-like HicB family nuclease
MKHEFTSIIEQDGEWYIAYCPEIPGANGQGKTKDEAKVSLSEAISLILQDRLEDALRSVPASAIRDVVAFG